ncbi:hypothetical protein C5167_009531 [Papaver somniferum]|uniref:Uncharacterized protein n=1 Tax=Papaver somniferum TaxID=3469 RepID=A0A4Y7K1M3_PAPSO|nr:hypothetical protein C5167_009531 [Papaver somniferum]
MRYFFSLYYINKFPSNQVVKTKLGVRDAPVKQANHPKRIGTCNSSHLRKNIISDSPINVQWNSSILSDNDDMIVDALMEPVHSTVKPLDSTYMQTSVANEDFISDYSDEFCVFRMMRKMLV